MKDLPQVKNGYKRYSLSLTGENSHIFDLQAGQGSLSIGTKGISEGKYDIWVEPGDTINWDAFNECFTYYGERQKKEHPFGDWPRWIYYSGMDTGFIEWTSKRKTEGFHWTPTKDVSVDMENVVISERTINLKQHVKMTVGPKVRMLVLEGNPENAEVKTCGKAPELVFALKDYENPDNIYRIPDFKELQDTAFVGIESSPVGDVFDCESLRQFKHVKTLNIWGNVKNTSVLSELTELENIGMRYVPDMSGFPDVRSWKNLDRFIGWNIEETAGKDLRKQLKALEKEKELDYQISQLRSKTWFATEYDNPFKNWEGTKGRKASKLYKDYLKEIKKVPDEASVRDNIIRFTEAFNAFDDLDTVEREDTYDAVRRLIMASPFEIDENIWLEWFDGTRDF